MTKIICNNLGMLESNTYKGQSGKEYLFQLNIPTDVKDNNDALGFLTSGDGTGFKTIGQIDTIIKKLKELVQFNKTFDVNDSDIELNVTEDISADEEQTDEDVSHSTTISEQKAEIEKHYIELKKLNRVQQTKMIKELFDKLDNSELETSIPKLEDDKIIKILELEELIKQKEDNIEYDD